MIGNAMTSEPNPTDYLGDPLNPISRKARRDLLAASSIGILVSIAGLVPTRISALGIDLSLPEQRGLPLVMALVVLYFIAAFVTYGLSDFFIWRKRYQDHLEHVERFVENLDLSDQEAYEEMSRRLPDIGWLYRWSKPLTYVRVFFEFALPVLVGVCAIVWLLITVWHH
jgi:hypothetical protein